MCVCVGGPFPSGCTSLSKTCNLQGDEYPVARCRGSVRGQRTCLLTQSDSHAGSEPLRVSRHKQTVTVCTRGERYRAAIVSQAAILSSQQIPTPPALCRTRTPPLPPPPPLGAALCIVYADLSVGVCGVEGWGWWWGGQQSCQSLSMFLLRSAAVCLLVCFHLLSPLSPPPIRQRR